MLVQVITTTWTKQSRGAPTSAIRNMVPEALAIPNDQPIQLGGLLVHSAKFNEKNDFHVHESVEIVTCASDLLGMSFLESPKGVDVLYSDSSGCGYPGRPGLRRTQLFCLGSGEIGRLRINWRYSGSMCQHGEWVYVKEVINVANVTAFATDLFVSSAYKLADHMADLW